MALFENSLAELVERLCRIPLQDYRGGTCTTAVSTTSFKDSSRKEADDYFQNTSPISWVRIIATTDGADPIGSEAQISDFVNSDGAITYTPVTTAVVAGDKYIILAEYRWDELKEAINTAIDYATSRNILIEKSDESLTIQDDTYEYTIPAGFTHIYRLAQMDGSGNYPDVIPPDAYKIIRGTALPRIHFYRFPTDQLFSGHWAGETWISSDRSDGKTLRIEGFGRQPKLENEWDVCYLDPNVIIYQAAALLHSARIRQSTSDYDAQRVRAEECNNKAREFLAVAKEGQQFPPNIKRVK